MSDRTIQILQSLGATCDPSRAPILNLCPASAPPSSDDTEYLKALLEDSRDAAIDAFGAASFAVGNVSDDPDVEDVGVLLGPGEVRDAWGTLVDRLELDLTAFAEPKTFASDLDDQVGIIKGSKLYNLLSGLQGLEKVTAATRDEGVLLVAWIGKRQTTGTVVALLGATETT